MGFQNEYVPGAEAETSEFLRRARTALDVGHARHDAWTVDRVSEMVLVRTGRKPDDHYGTETWRFLGRTGAYAFTTSLLQCDPVSPEEIRLKRQIAFGPGEVPPPGTLQAIRRALETYKDLSVASSFSRCELVLVDGNGKVL